MFNGQFAEGQGGSRGGPESGHGEGFRDGLGLGRSEYFAQSYRIRAS